MTETPRETRVLDAVVSLVDTLLEDFDVVDLLTELTERCAELLEVAAADVQRIAGSLRLHREFEESGFAAERRRSHGPRRRR